MTCPWELQGAVYFDARGEDLPDGAEVTEWAGLLNGGVGTGAFYDVDAATPNFDIDGFATEAGIVFTTGGTERLRSDANLISSASDYSLVVRMQFPEAHSSHNHTAMALVAADGSVKVSVQVNGYETPDGLRVFDGANSVLAGTIALDTTMTLGIVHRNAAAELDVYLDGLLVDTIAVTNAADVRRIEIGHANNTWDPEYSTAQKHQAMLWVPIAFDATDVADATTYLDTLDTDYAGGLTREILFDDIRTSSEVRVYECPHPQSWAIDTTGLVAADIGGKYLTFQVQGESSASDHYLWFDYDNGSSDPAPAGRTGHCVELSTGDTDEDIADAIQAVLDAVTDLGATVSTTLVTVTDDRNGELEAPEDVDSGAVVTVIEIGGTSTDEIDGIESTTGTSWSASYIVLFPRRVTVGIWHQDAKTIWFELTVTTDGHIIQAGLLQDDDDAYDLDLDPGWTHETEATLDFVARTITLAQASDVVAAYVAIKGWQDSETDWLRYPPALQPIGFGDAFELPNGWDWEDSTTRGRLRGSGYRLSDDAGAITEEWINIQSGPAGLEGEAYYLHFADDTPHVLATGPVDGVVQVYVSGTDHRDQIILLARPWAKTWGDSATDDQGIIELNPQNYVLPLPEVGDDTANTTERATVAGWSDVIVTFGHCEDSETNPYDLEIDGGARTGSQVYERSKYLTDEDQTATLDGTAGRVYRGQELLLPYDTQTGAFTEGLIVTGTTSGASARIVADHGTALTVRRTAEAHGLDFVDGEAITDTSTGAAAVNGTPTRYARAHYPLCRMEGNTLVGARGVLITNASGALRLTDSLGVEHVPLVSTTLTIHCVDAETSADVAGARVRVIADAGGDYTPGDVLLSGVTDANGEVSDIIEISTAQPVSGWARKASAAPLYKNTPFSGSVTPGTNLVIAATMTPD